MPLKKPPPSIDGARVLEWAWSDTPFGELRDTEGGVAALIHGLAICQYDGDSRVYRFSCDANWACEQDQIYDSAEQAKSQLPTQYGRVDAVWHRA